jgi:hypothetical protein
MSNGKGDTPRPISVDQETFASNWERAFGTRVPPLEKKQSVIDEQKFTYMTERHSGMFYEWYPELTGEWEQDKTRWMLARMMREHVKKIDCEYSGLPSVNSYTAD